MSRIEFKNELLNVVIPHIGVLIEKEQNHLIWLKNNKSPYIFIVRSENMLNHYKARLQEYIEYANTL